ncbi:glycosyltransferase [Engelhardtia mirabilis]|uniref:GDP-mannose:cellobiosyl-diphosphopolyprenol alpha-mannosyltransferase n=1 Tax=Engelhardtia mirabilis TaxID=2528011 RepID=A0A518BJI0_9BACT|nr:GDP-mannose:cellobiosyl-diphosphopolyprenol alpha-mannosyltransferase [Planctomycetes bacterium Pla133]QDV01468.1 GDP-mannose:cellobiosyl-diphosphopolyprenol alpha-mannosyltransferase [Planctomycetes bacterium Pla86]
MKILQVVPSYLPGVRYGGPIRSVHGLSRALVERGHEVSVFTTDRDEGERLDVPLGRPVEIDGVRVRYFEVRGPTRLRWSPPMGRALRQEIESFDLVHTHGLFHWPGTAAARVARQSGTPYVIAPRGMLIRDMLLRRGKHRKRAWLGLIERENLEGAAALHLTAELEREQLPDLGYPLPASFVLENGVEPLTAPDRGAVREDVASLIDSPRRLVLFLGRLNWKKGLDRLVASVPAWPDDVHLVIAGPDDGAEAGLRRLLARLGLAGRVTLTGAVSGDTRAALLTSAELLVLPSYSENFGNVVLEAWSAGTATAVTPEVGAAALVAEVGAGAVVDGGQLARDLTDLLGRPGLLESMGLAGKRAASERYSWRAIAERAEGEFKSLAGRLRAAV